MAEKQPAVQPLLQAPELAEAGSVAVLPEPAAPAAAAAGHIALVQTRNASGPAPVKRSTQSPPSLQSINIRFFGITLLNRDNNKIEWLEYIGGGDG